MTGLLRSSPVSELLRCHFQSGMDPLGVVIMDVGINSFQHVPLGVKAIELAEFVLEATKERLTISVLPRGCHLTDRDDNAVLLQIMSTQPCHKFVALIGMEDTRHFSSGEGLLKRGKHQMSVMSFTNLSGDNLSSG